MNRPHAAPAFSAHPIAAPPVMPPSILAMRCLSAPRHLLALEADATDALVLLTAGDFPGAIERFADFETALNAGESYLGPLNPGEWIVIKYAADVASRSLRASRPIAADARMDLIALIVALQGYPVS